MRILQINSATNFGGGEKYLADLTRGLQICGHEIFVTLRQNAVWHEKLNHISDANILHLPLYNALDLQSAWKLAKFIEHEDIQIVHAHLARDYSIAALAVRLSRTKTRLVLTRHVLFPLNGLHKFLLPKNTIVIAVSSAVQNQVQKQKLVPQSCVKLIYNGVDTNYFAATVDNFNHSIFLERLKLPPNRRFVGMLGEITAHKGQIDFVRAAALVAEQHEDVDFLIVGRDSSPEKKYQAELEKLINELNLANRVYLPGWCSDVAPVLCALEIFVSPSRVEPFGLAIVEAMAAGLPIVATASEGAQEILVDNETGRLVPISDNETMANAINYFLSDKKVRDDFGKKARMAAREKFELTRMVDETESLYKEVLREA